MLISSPQEECPVPRDLHHALLKPQSLPTTCFRQSMSRQKFVTSEGLSSIRSAAPWCPKSECSLNPDTRSKHPKPTKQLSMQETHVC